MAEKSLTQETPTDLQALPLTELEQLWDSVPTEYQDRLKRRYTQILKAKGIADDKSELDLIKSYLSRYETEGLIPAGDKWLKISPSARKDFHLETSDSSQDEESDKTSRPPILLIGGLIAIVLILIFTVTRFMSSNDAMAIATDGTPYPTETITPTATATIIPTETPLALMDADRFVGDSDGRSNRDFYPVVFRVVPPNSTPRVFLVQERLVETTEWQYEGNPDVASWLSGMHIFPVLGIPFSEDNLRLFQSFESDTRFILRMNTGAELSFQFDDMSEIPRDNTALFSQRQPGLAVVLIGQVDEEGLPTPLRLVATGRYNSSQELENLSNNIISGLPVVEGISADLNGLTITVAGAQVTDDGDFSTIRVVLQLTADQRVNLENFQWLLEDSNGLQYTARSRAFPHTNLNEGAFLATNITFRIPKSVKNGQLVVISETGISQQFRLDWETPDAPTAISELDVQIRFLERDDRRIYIGVRVFNPTATPLTLSETDVWLVSGYVADPPGPQRHPLDFVPLVLEPNQAWDSEWHFDWNGSDPYAAFGIAGRHYTVTLKEQQL